jgi:colanic acid/amylovoran biosynthesis glycosyltransferase
MKKKVILCSNTFETTDNGPAKFAQLLIANNDDSINIEYFILTEDIRIETNNIIKIKYRLSSKLKVFGQFYRIFLYAIYLNRLDKTHNFDKVIFNTSYQGLLTFFFGFRKRIIGMINDYEICELKFFKDFYHKPNLYIYGKLEKLSIYLYPKIIVNSIFLKNKIIKITSVKNEKVSILYKGIQIKDFAFHRKEMGNLIEVIFVKSDFMRGGLFDLINALGNLKNYQFKLNVIGPSERFYGIILKQAIQYTNLEISLLGVLSQKDTLAKISTSDIFCVPSHREALGVANIEAMNLCVSVITTNVGGIPEVVNNSDNVWMVNPNNFQELSAALNECISNTELRYSKIENAYKQSLNFSFVKTIEKLNQILQE